MRIFHQVVANLGGSLTIHKFHNLTLIWKKTLKTNVKWGLCGDLWTHKIYMNKNPTKQLFGICISKNKKTSIQQKKKLK